MFYLFAYWHILTISCASSHQCFCWHNRLSSLHRQQCKLARPGDLTGHSTAPFHHIELLENISVRNRPRKISKWGGRTSCRNQSLLWCARRGGLINSARGMFTANSDTSQTLIFFRKSIGWRLRLSRCWYLTYLILPSHVIPLGFLLTSNKSWVYWHGQWKVFHHGTPLTVRKKLLQCWNSDIRPYRLRISMRNFRTVNSRTEYSSGTVSELRLADPPRTRSPAVYRIKKTENEAKAKQKGL
jgi:hypothetical protein